jgi:hypothetical protein
MADSTFFAANQPVHKKAAEEIYLFSFQGTDFIETNFFLEYKSSLCFCGWGGISLFYDTKFLSMPLFAP